jgi:hypothetical protein
LSFVHVCTADVQIVALPAVHSVYVCYWLRSRTQWPRLLRHELSSFARTLGSCVRIPLKAWMSVLCAFILCLCCSVCRYRFCDGLIPRPRSPTDYIWDQGTEKRPTLKKGCRAIIIIILIIIIWLQMKHQRLIKLALCVLLCRHYSY